LTYLLDFLPSGTGAELLSYEKELTVYY